MKKVVTLLLPFVLRLLAWEDGTGVPYFVLKSVAYESLLLLHARRSVLERYPQSVSQIRFRILASGISTEPPNEPSRARCPWGTTILRLADYPIQRQCIR